MRDVVIVDAVRSPMGRGKKGGALSDVHPVDLLAQVLSALIDRNQLDASTVDDVLIGCVTQAGEQSAGIGRMAWLAAGLPVEVPAVTIERKCGSGQQAMVFAAQAIASGMQDIVIAGGVESMSRVPMGAAKLDQDGYGPALRARYPKLAPQGIAAERVAHKYALTRTQLDEYSARSHHRAAATAENGHFANEIVPIRTPDGTIVAADETIRPASSVESLAGLQPAFASPDWASRFPEIDFAVTAGNSSQLTDGASVALLMSRARAHELGLTPRAVILDSVVVGDDPELMLTAPIPATRKLLDRLGMKADDIDAYEVNEAFASVPLAWQAELGVDSAKLNPRGGAIALGHPLGASGTRLFTTMLNHLEQTGGAIGVQTMCEAGGMANAFAIAIEPTKESR
ncbi:thiolase family protein [Microbacterium sp. NC79]|uniref:thiolase family protein n=1 Tax=Microbacterium sp. NC79 TaxID=2851009 RepID=UPI001C2C972D|nr:thiolase family protein [Microbacterium sp. NC79]MBV0896126.1 thiolase family protein [Microbacterium sp. NC79]